MLQTLLKKQPDTTDLKYFFIIFFLIVFLIFWGFSKIIYIELKSTVAANYTYAIFLANALVTNFLFALGRSDVFIIQYPEISNRKLIYRAGVLFLTSSVISLLSAAVIYFELNFETKVFGSQEFYDNIIRTIFSFLIMVSLILSIVGFFSFTSWCITALTKYVNELNDNLSNDNLKK